MDASAELVHHYIYGNNKNISLGTKIQEEVIKTNMKEYFSRIPFEENLLYLGVVLCFVECGVWGNGNEGGVNKSKSFDMIH